MTPLRHAATDYLALRRALGFKLRATEDALIEFMDFLDRRGATTITAAVAVEWASSRQSTRPGFAADRLRRIRGFTRHHLLSDPATEVTPANLLPSHRHRRQPYLYSDDEISRLMTCALKLPPGGSLRGATYHCLLGLLSVTGMRLGEAIRLEVGDVDLDQCLLTIRQTKFGKSRFAPIADSTRLALVEYRTQRDRFAKRLAAPQFFISGRRTALDPGHIHRTFYQLLDEAEVRGPAGVPRPRLHDLRHRFAIQTLLRWYRSGQDVEHHMPTLATFLGHVRIEHTYWYLSACPELMGHALTRFERHWEKLS